MPSLPRSAVEDETFHIARRARETTIDGYCGRLCPRVAQGDTGHSRRARPSADRKTRRERKRRDKREEPQYYSASKRTTVVAARLGGSARHTRRRTEEADQCRGSG